MLAYEDTRQRLTARVNPGVLKGILDYQNLSYRDAAFKTGVSMSTIANIVSGRRKQVNPATAGKIAKAFNVPTDTLFTLTEVV